MSDKSRRFKLGGSNYITVHSSGYFQVRFGKIISCGFRDIAKAEAYRDAVQVLLEEARANYRGNLSYRMYLKLRSTDYIGVSFYENAFVAQWNDGDGNRVKAYFNVNTHGYDAARSMAIAARDAAVGVYPFEIMDKITKLTRDANSGKFKGKNAVSAKGKVRS